MTYRMKASAAGALIVASALLSSCNDADVASQNLSTAADNFKVMRRITVIAGITDKTLLVIEGLCSLGNHDPDRLPSITCKDERGQFKKDFIGMGDNVTYLVEQLDPVAVSDYRYKVIIKPAALIPDFEIK